MSLLLFFDVASALFDLCHGSGINKSWRITHGEGNENSERCLEEMVFKDLLFFSLLLSRIFGDYNIFLFSSFSLFLSLGFWFQLHGQRLGSGKTVPARLSLDIQHPRLNGQISACVCVCVYEKSQPTEKIFKGYVRVCLYACDTSPT